MVEPPFLRFAIELCLSPAGASPRGADRQAIAGASTIGYVRILGKDTPTSSRSLDARWQLARHEALATVDRGGQKTLPSKPTPEEIWSAFLSGPLLGKVIKTRRRFFSLFRAKDRCKNCRAPFDSLGGLIMPMIGHGRYGKNPRFCRF